MVLKQWKKNIGVGDIMDKEDKKEIIENLEEKKTYRAYGEEFRGFVDVEAHNLKEAGKKVMDLIDIHKIDENGEIIIDE